MSGFAQQARKIFGEQPIKMLDVGSASVNGSYRPLFEWPGVSYTGLDMAPGENVHFVPKDMYDWRELPDQSFDIIISGQALEHIEFPWLTVEQMSKKIKTGGLICLIAPSRGPEHRFPTDCYRYYPDGMKALAKWAGLKVLLANYVPPGTSPDPASDTFGDCMCVMTKEVSSPPARKETPTPGMENNLALPLSQVLPVIQQRLLTQSTYFGVRALKSPTDFWVYQEIIWAMKPDVIVEVGTASGGGTLALAHLCDLIGKGRVIGLDLTHEAVPEVVKKHSRVTLLAGDACQNFPRVRTMISSHERVLVIEDSSHTYENTLKVLRTFNELVKVGDYLIVEDSICQHGLATGPARGPYEAIETFVKENPAFEIDRGKESFLITWNPKGYLKRVRPANA
jgi:cephalosporin hydroxylase